MTTAANARPGGTGALAGRPVARIGFGAMQLPGPGVWGPPRDRDTAIAVLRRAVDLGVDHLDTAQYYGPDVANELIRAALCTRTPPSWCSSARSAPSAMREEGGIPLNDPSNSAPAWKPTCAVSPLSGSAR